MSEGSDEPLPPEQALRDANRAWVDAVEALRAARLRTQTAPEEERPEAFRALVQAEERVMRAGERLAVVAGKLADARRGAR